MKKAIKRLGPFDKGKKCLNVVVETPKGSSVKYSFDQELGIMQLKRALPEGMVFPFNFGFVPGTISEDGDQFSTVAQTTLETVEDIRSSKWGATAGWSRFR